MRKVGWWLFLLVLLFSLSLPGFGYSGEKFPAVYASIKPTMDGELSEWAQAPFFVLANPRRVKGIEDWGGESDLSALFSVMWDEENLYIAVEVHDDKFYQEWTGGFMWLGDSVQFALDPLHDASKAWYGPDDHEYDMALTADGPRLWRRHGARGLPLGEVTAGRLAVVRDSGITRYELALPYDQLTPLSPEVGKTIGFSILVNDNDGLWRRGWIEWGEGIGTTKDPRKYGEIVFEKEMDYSTTIKYAPYLVDITSTKRAYMENSAVEIVIYPGIPLNMLIDSVKMSIVMPGGKSIPIEEVKPKEDSLYKGAWEAFWNTGKRPDGDYLILTELNLMGGEKVGPIYSGFRILGATQNRLVEKIKQLKSQIEAIKPQVSTPFEEEVLASCLVRIYKAERILPNAIEAYVIDKLRNYLRDCEELLNALKAGEDPFEGKKGFLLKGYISKIDNSPQPYGLYIPTTYDPAKPTPVVIAFHTATGDEMEFNNTLLEKAAEKIGVIILAPYGRGRPDFSWDGEEDVMEALAQLKMDYNVDESRIYLYGLSTGAEGALRLALHYPHLFAGVALISGTYKQDYADTLGNIAHLPIYMLHGSDDIFSPVSEARVLRDTLQRAGAELVYREFPDVGHSTFEDKAEDVLKWLLQYRRNPGVRVVRFASSSLKYGRMYWLSCLRTINPAYPLKVDARLMEGEGGKKHLRIMTRNVSALSIDAFGLPVSPDEGLLITVDQREVRSFDNIHGLGNIILQAELDKYGRVKRWEYVNELREEGIPKRPGVQGPIMDAFTSSFILVYGASGSKEQTLLNLEAAEAFGNTWRQNHNGRAIIKSDKEVGQEDIASANLILFGTPVDNIVIRKIHRRLPVRFGLHTIQLGHHRFRGEDVGIKLVYPNPLNPNRYVVLNSALGEAGYKKLSEIRDEILPDYVVFDSRTDPNDLQTYLSYGYFDAYWQLSE